VIAAADAEVAREQAREILSGSRYREPQLPKPFEGVLEWLGRRLRPIADAWDAIADWFLSAPLPVRLLALVLVVGLVASLAWRLARSRAAPASARARTQRREDASLDPGELERAADRAEREGDLDRALRLRFRAGLLRLDGAGLVEYRPSITSGEVARSLGAPTFDRLAARHDEVVYGGRAATPTDVEDARTTWPELVRVT